MAAVGSSMSPDGWLVHFRGYHLSAGQGIGILADRQPCRTHLQAGGPPRSTPGAGRAASGGM